MKYLLIIVASASVGVYGANWYENSRVRSHDQIVVDSFRIGCEAGVLQKCSPSEMESCKKMCHKIITENKDIIQLLRLKK